MLEDIEASCTDGLQERACGNSDFFTGRRPDRNAQDAYGRRMDDVRLAAIAFFAGLAEHELDVVARVATQLDFDAGSPLTTQGEFGHALFVIDSGTAEVSAGGVRLG